MMRQKAFTFLLVSLFGVSLYAGNDDKQPPPPPQERNISIQMGRIEQITPQSMSVRVGDATKIYTFDNKTVFTYGAHMASARQLKSGQEVFVSAKKKGKAETINVTQRIEGVIQKIDLKDKKLTVKFGDDVEEIPFTYFAVATTDGKSAPIEDMKEGDGVMLDVNAGFARKGPR